MIDWDDVWCKHPHNGYNGEECYLCGKVVPRERQRAYLIPPHCADVPLELALPEDLSVPR